MLLFKIISRYFWALAIIVTFMNGYFFKISSKKHIEDEPELEEERNKLIRGYLLWMNAPWIVMGIGCTIGNVPTVWHYFRPRDGNPFVLAWWLSAFVAWIVSFYWVFFLKGAEKLAKHRIIGYHRPGKSGYVSNPVLIKLLLLFCLSGGLIAAVVMWLVEVPLPEF